MTVFAVIAVAVCGGLWVWVGVEMVLAIKAWGRYGRSKGDSRG